MLSRIAESLFWIGRYTERAEATARLLQVQLRIVVEDPWTPASDTCRGLLILMGVEDGAWGEHDPDHEDLIKLLGYDRAQISSVTSCWDAIRDHARRAREVIPQEVWELINTTWQRLPRGSSPATRSNVFLEWARERGALFTGLARGTMVRDDGWQFLVLGRSIEQADMTARMIASATVSGTSSPWLTVLRDCGAYDAFLRTYRGVRASQEAAGFLLTDRRFPRSIIPVLDTSITTLEELQRTYGTPDSAAAGVFELRRLRAHLEFTAIDDIVARLSSEMSGVWQTCEQVTGLITRTFFNPSDDVAWTTEESR